MASGAEILFIIKDGGAGGGSPKPGGAAGGGPTGAPRPGATAPGQPGAKPAKDEPGGKSLGEQVREALKRFSEYQIAPASLRAGFEFLKPLLGLEKLFRDFRTAGGDGAQTKPGAAAGAAAGGLAPLQPAKIDRADFLGPDKAVFNAQNARFVIQGGRYYFPHSPGGPRSRGPMPRANLPAPQARLPGPTSKAPVPTGLPFQIPGSAGGGGGAGVGAAAGAAARAGGTAAAGLAGVAVGAAALTLGIGLLVVAVGAAVMAMKALYDRANRQAEQLAAFSPALAQAQAQAQMRTLQQQIRSADANGAQLARMVDAQSRAGVAIDRILDVFQERLMSRLIPLIEGIATVLEKMALASEYWQVISQFVDDLVAGKVNIFNAITELGDRLEKIEDKKETRRGDLLALFLDIPDLDINDTAGHAGRRAGDKSMFINMPGMGTFYDPPY